MRIAVIGAGAIGGTIAALLDRGGHAVTVTARGVQLDALQTAGVRLSGAWGEHTAAVSASNRLLSTPELAFICTKAQDAAEAIDDNSAFLSGIPVVIVQNGLSGVDDASRLLPASECLGAIAVFAARFLEPGEVAVTAAAKTYLGVGDSGASPLVRQVTDLLGAVMPAVAVSNFRGCQWTKLIVNQVNAMPAITGLSAQQTLADPSLRRVITSGMREAVRIGFAAGVRFGSIQGLDNLLLRLMAAAPLAAGQIIPWAMGRRMGPTPNSGSTLQSIRRGQLTEIDYLNGEVVRQAVELGRTAPINAELTALVHEVERAGSFLGADTVLARIRALRDVPQPEI